MTKQAFLSSLLCLVLAAGMLATSASAQSGRDYAVASQSVSFGYRTLTATADMTLYRGNSVIGTRSLDIALVEQPSGAHDLALITIKAPTSLEGTKLLSWSNDKGDDQQWLTTGNTDRARRIGDRGRKATFVNSDFTFEDLLKWQVDSYRYETVGASSCPAGSCTQVRAIPTSRVSAYAEMLIDYDSSNRISRIQYFRKAGDPVWKELVASNYTRVGNSSQPRTSVMTDYSTNTRTKIDWSNYRADTQLDTSIFSPN